jgi:hypothetical protein
MVAQASKALLVYDSDHIQRQRPRVYGPENGSSKIESVRANLQDMVVSSTTSIPILNQIYLLISLHQEMHQHIMYIILIVSNHVTYLDQNFFCETQLFDGHIVYH